MKDKIINKSRASSRQKIYAIDLFCGAGGLTHGLIRSGINVCLGVDIDPECQFPYTSNNNAQFLLKSVENIKAQDLLCHYKKKGN